MTKQPKPVSVRTINREDFAGVYANNTIISFNPYEFTLEFNIVDSLVASDRINSGDKEVPAKTVAKVLMSHKSMEEFVSTINKVYSDFKKAQE
jgi:hypothetical protein